MNNVGLSWLFIPNFKFIASLKSTICVLVDQYSKIKKSYRSPVKYVTSNILMSRVLVRSVTFFTARSDGTKKTQKTRCTHHRCTFISALLLTKQLLFITMLYQRQHTKHSHTIHTFINPIETPIVIRKKMNFFKKKQKTRCTHHRCTFISPLLLTKQLQFITMLYQRQHTKHSHTIHTFINPIATPIVIRKKRNFFKFCTRHV
jgi:hypothetical protein